MTSVIDGSKNKIYYCQVHSLFEFSETILSSSFIHYPGSPSLRIYSTGIIPGQTYKECLKDVLTDFKIKICESLLNTCNSKILNLCFHLSLFLLFDK